jgi:hypothetical protein
MKMARTMVNSGSMHSRSQKCDLDDLRAYPYAQESITASLMLMNEQCARLPGRIS